MRSKHTRRIAATATLIAALTMGTERGTAAADPNEWTSFTGVAPGTAIGQRVPQENGMYVCTLAFIAREETTRAKKAITAGHCDHSAVGQRTVFYTGSSDPDIARPLGTYSRSHSNTHSADSATSSAGLPAGTDAGIIDINPGVHPSSYQVAGVYQVTHALRPDPVLTPGTEVCKYGARTGETCGPVVAADSDRVTVRMRIVKGDSGAPAYIKTGADTITAVGILSGHLREDPDIATIYYLYPVIESLGLKVCGIC